MKSSKLLQYSYNIPAQLNAVTSDHGSMTLLNLREPRTTSHAYDLMRQVMKRLLEI